MSLLGELRRRNVLRVAAAYVALSWLIIQVNETLFPMFGFSDAADISLTVHPHPTLSETIAFAAEAYEGTLTDLYLPRKK